MIGLTPPLILCLQRGWIKPAFNSIQPQGQFRRQMVQEFNLERLNPGAFSPLWGEE